MSPSDEEELSYHLRELHADLGLIRADLEIAAASEIDRSVIGAWTGATALLEHDLEVHLPRALELLGAQIPPQVGLPREPATDATSRIFVAVEAKRLVERALEMLPPASEPIAAIDKLSRTARTVQEAHDLVASMNTIVYGLHTS